MRFYEFESKRLFGKHGIPLPTGSRVAHTPERGARRSPARSTARWCSSRRC